MSCLSVDTSLTRGQAKAKGSPETAYFHLFRRHVEPDLYCAIPQDRPVPQFVVQGGWAFAGGLRSGDERAIGFDAVAAELGVNLNGFHLFQCATAPAGAPVALAAAGDAGTRSGAFARKG